MPTNINTLLKLDPRVLAGSVSGVTVIPNSTPLTRLNYFDGKFLRADDLRAEQLYLRRLVQLSNQAGPTGIANGFDLSLAKGGDILQVSAGLAIAPDGSVLLLPADASAAVQDLIDQSAQVLRPAASGTSGVFSDCTTVSATPSNNGGSTGNLFLITVAAAEALCGSEDVFGKLCEEACATSTDRPYVVEGIVLRARPLRLQTKLITSKAVAISSRHLRSQVASAYFADERLVTPSLISGAGLRSTVWCSGADAPGGNEVPIGVIARSGNQTLFLDVWTARREAIETAARRYWAWRMSMRPWDAFLAQVLQFQCQLSDLFRTSADPKSGDPCADRNSIIKDASATVGQLADFYEAVTTRFTLQPLLSGGSAAANLPEVAGGLANISGLFKRLATARDQFLIPSTQFLIDGNILETPPGAYLPVDPLSALTVNQQVRRLMGKGVDLRFCVVRPDYVPHALESVQHMERISLVQGLDDPKNMPKVDVLVPDGQIAGQAAPRGTAFQATIQALQQSTTGTGTKSTARPISTGSARIDVPDSGPVQFFLAADSENPAPLLVMRPLIARLSTSLFANSALASRLSSAAPALASNPTTSSEWIGLTATQNPFAPEATGQVGFEFRMVTADTATPPVFENLRLNGVYRFTRAVSTGADLRITGTLSGTFSNSTAKGSSGGEIPGIPLELTLTPPLSGAPGRLRGRFPMGKLLADIVAEWSGDPMVVHIVESVTLETRRLAAIEMILQENPDVLAPSNVFHRLALNGVKIAAAALTTDSEFATVTANQLFPPSPPATDELIVKATLDWVLFHRRRDKQCGAVAATPQPLPPRTYRIYHHATPLKAGVNDSVVLIRQALIAGNSTFLEVNKILFHIVDTVEFGAGVPTLDTAASSILVDWKKANPAKRIVYAAIASQGAAAQDGDELALDRLDTLEKTLIGLPGTALDPDAGPDVLKQILSPPFDSTNADGVIIILTQPEIPTFNLTANAKPVNIAAGARQVAAGAFFLNGQMSAPGGAGGTIPLNLEFTSDLPLSPIGAAPPALQIDDKPPVLAKVTGDKTFAFPDLSIQLPGDPPAHRAFTLTGVVLDSRAAVAGDSVFLTVTATSTSGVNVIDGKQLVGTVTGPALVPEGGRSVRLFLQSGGQPGARQLKTTQPLLLAFDASNKVAGTVPAGIDAGSVKAVEYNTAATGAAVNARLDALMEALKSDSVLAPGAKPSVRKLAANEKHFLEQDGVTVDDLVFLSI